MKKMKASVIAKISSVFIIIILTGVLLNLCSCKAQETVMVHAPANADEIDDYINSAMLKLSEREKQILKEYDSQFTNNVHQCTEYK